jgi:hypothetical protein
MFPEQNHHLDREYRPNSFVGANLPVGPGAERGNFGPGVQSGTEQKYKLFYAL